MNYAVLSKLQALSGSPLELIEKSKQATRFSESPGRAETAFYLSAENPDIFYILSLWYDLKDFYEACAQPRQPQDEEHKATQQLLGNSIFQLYWDYRRVHLPIVASSLHLLTYPDDISEQCYQETVNTFRRLKGEISGLNGIWTGRCLSPGPQRITLHRADWNSLQEQQAFFRNETLQQTMQRYREEGVVIEVASFDLQGLVQPTIELPPSQAEAKLKNIGSKRRGLKPADRFTRL